MDKQELVDAVVAVFWQRFSADLPEATETKRKAGMIKAFNGRKIAATPPGNTDFFTGSWGACTPYEVTTASGETVTIGYEWTGVRKRVSVGDTVTLQCDGDTITMTPPTCSTSIIYNSYAEWYAATH